MKDRNIILYLHSNQNIIPKIFPPHHTEEERLVQEETDRPGKTEGEKVTSKIKTCCVGQIYITIDTTIQSERNRYKLNGKNAPHS